jgi:hypothetical protein
MDERQKIDWAQQDKKLLLLLEKQQALPTNHPFSMAKLDEKSWLSKNSSAPTKYCTPTNAFSHSVATGSGAGEASVNAAVGPVISSPRHFTVSAPVSRHR